MAALLLALLELLALLAPRGAGSHADEAAPHGLEHPPVTIRTHPPTGRLAWSAARAGWLELRVGVRGAIPGFRYRVMLEAIAEGSEGRHHYIGGNPLQRWELAWPDCEEHARAELVSFVISPGVHLCARARAHTHTVCVYAHACVSVYVCVCVCVHSVESTLTHTHTHQGRRA